MYFCLIYAQIYDAAVRWLKYDVCNRQQYMVEVLGCVRFPLVSKTFLSKTVQAEPLIQENPQCLKMVISEEEEETEEPMHTDHNLQMTMINSQTAECVVFM